MNINQTGLNDRKRDVEKLDGDSKHRDILTNYLLGQGIEAKVSSLGMGSFIFKPLKGIN